MKNFFAVLLISFLIMSITPFKIEAEDERSEQYFKLIDDVIEADTRFGLSGAQLAIIHEGELVHSKAYGYKNNFRNVYNSDGSVNLKDYTVIPIGERVPVTTDTLFDLASNTKMYGLNYAIQHLVQEGELSLDTKVADIFKDNEDDLQFKYRGYGENYQSEITIKDLLEHTAGFMSDPRYHDNLSEVNHDYFEDAEPKNNPLFSHDRELTKRMVLHTPLVYERGSRHLYSDADFMLLGFIVEEITGMRLDEYMKKTFYEPLGLDRITFNPLDNGFLIDEIVASEVHGTTRSGFFSGDTQYKNIRETVVDGEVHDEKAFYSMGGISGHAGLFGTAEDIAKLAQHMLKDQSKLLSGSKPLFTNEIIDMFSEGSPLNDTYAVGWRRQGANKGYKGYFSKYASENTIGHTGWTGTLTVIDPEHDLVIALFTNSRNTPQMTDENTFYSYRMNVSTYDTVAELIYEALNLGSDRTPSDIIIDLFEAKLNQITGDGSPDKLANVTISERNALRSLISVIEKMSVDSNILKDYMETDLFHNILLSLEINNDNDFRILSNPESYRIGHQRLKNLFEEVKETENLYTEKSWLDFENALKQAEEVLTDVLASQIEVNETYDVLKTAFESLKKEDADKPVLPDNPKDQEEPKKPLEPEDPIDSTDKDGVLPLTGSPWLTGTKVAGLGLSTLGSIILFLKRKKI